MRTVLITPATWLPFEVEAIKDRPELRLSGITEDDVTVAEAIQAAVEAYQEYTRRILCRSTWDLYLDEFPEDDDVIETPAPLASVESLKYVDSSGTTITLASSEYCVGTADPLAGRIQKIGSSTAWPLALERIDSVIVRFIAGYSCPNEIPRMIKDGLLLKIQEIMDGVDRSAAYEAKWLLRRIFIA